MDDYTNLKFASLFHDIGKFYQRADNFGKFYHRYDSKYEKLDVNDYGFSGAHSKWSADFVKDYFDDSIEDLVLYHHMPSNSIQFELCQMLQKADHHSSQERKKTTELNSVLETPLISIFSTISLNDKNPEESYIPLVELDFKNENNIYPQRDYIGNKNNLVNEYDVLWNKFKMEFNKLKNMDFESVLAILKKYTSTIPSAAYNSRSDISLYDHLKTTTAIANCRYLFSKEDVLKQDDFQDVYKIIIGDISGIQKFIYRVNTPEDARSGMSQRLRGRSLYLTLLTEAIANKIIIDLNLDSSNILFCGGGKFTIIAPNTKKTENIVNKIDNMVNRFFLKKFNAELYLAIVSMDVSGIDLKNFGKVISECNILLDENKKHKFVNHLNEIFKLEKEVNYGICVVCGGKTDNNTKFCKECKSHEKLGLDSTNARYLLKYKSEVIIPNSHFFVEFLNIGFIFKRDKEDIKNIINDNPNIEFCLYKLNDTNFLELLDELHNNNVSFDFKVLANSIPTINKKSLYFNHLAEISKGSNKIGVLKMDVDNLGEIFSRGFENIGGSSISRISSLSFYLDLFFLGNINQIINKFKVYYQDYGHDEYFYKTKLIINGNEELVYRFKEDVPNEIKQEYSNEGTSTIHINYSGGDDLLVLGPYDDIIRFALEFRNKFKMWVAENNSITLSAGLTIVSPKVPIGKVASIVDMELKKSKDCGKNKITLFNEVLGWDSNGKIKGLDELLEFSYYIEDLIIKKIVSKLFVYSLFKLWKYKSGVSDLHIFNKEEWDNKNIEKITKHRYVPLFKYNLKLIDDDYYEIREVLDKNGLKYMPWIKIPMSWVRLRLR